MIAARPSVVRSLIICGCAIGGCAIGGQSVLRLTGDRRPQNHPSSRAVRDRGEPYGRGALLLFAWMAPREARA